MQAFKRDFMPQALRYETTGSTEKEALKFMEHYSENMEKLLPKKVIVTSAEIRRLQTVAKAFQQSKSNYR